MWTRVSTYLFVIVRVGRHILELLQKKKLKRSLSFKVLGRFTFVLLLSMRGLCKFKLGAVETVRSCALSSWEVLIWRGQLLDCKEFMILGP